MKPLFSALALLGVLVTQAPSAETIARPNIIFILSDDVGLGNLSCFGGDKYKTPQLDALAQGGIRFDSCFSTPLCGPSRCQILTGRYPFRTGMTSNRTGPALKPQSEVMLPTVLKRAGYVTAQIGKWAQLPLQPGDWGFDEYLRFPRSGRYWRAQTPSYTLNGVQKNLPAETYLPDLMHDFLVDFIKRHRDQPFYVHYAMSHIHGPIVRTPDSAAGEGREGFYADNIAYMDKLVGKLVTELERLGLREKTLLVFVGDNGTAGSATKATVNGRPLSGHKGTMLEGGSRVPMIVNWPGTTPKGGVCEDLVDFSDFFPTFAELAGAKLPAGVTLDGRSFVPRVKGQPGNPRGWVYVELAGKRYVRTADWKLNNAGELFDMKEAPFKEIPVSRNSADAKAVAARKHLEEVLAGLAASNVAAEEPEPRAAKRDRPAKKKRKAAKGLTAA
jgi:arylsulfatase A